MNSISLTPPRAVWKHEGSKVLLEVSGNWRSDGPEVMVTGVALERNPTCYGIDHLETYDSTLPAFLLAHFRSVSSASKEKPTLDGLPESLRGLLGLALAVPEENVTQHDVHAASEIRRLGELSLKVWSDIREVIDFTGLTMLSLGRFFVGRARFRSADFWTTLQECGAQALPIVSLLSFLIGAILAFVGNVQLINFGANLFVADLVGIAMVREMGVMITAIIMSGRTGAAFAAHIGSMKANEEIDALRTFGFNPFDFLVLPRFLSLVLMMPLLTIYANIVGILGGMLVGAFVGIPPVLYWTETLTAIDMTNSSLGVMKSVFFGAAIAIFGCMQGMRSGNSSAAVGIATTRAVVTAITAVIILDSAFAAIFTVLDI
jgi:phospholipid/cholesterol/gamma-HCH transport system permease protein